MAAEAQRGSTVESLVVGVGTRCSARCSLSRGVAAVARSGRRPCGPGEREASDWGGGSFGESCVALEGGALWDNPGMSGKTWSRHLRDGWHINMISLSGAINPTSLC